MSETKGIVLIATSNSDYYRYCCAFCIKARQHYDGAILILTDLGEAVFQPLVQECRVEVRRVVDVEQPYRWSEIRTTLVNRTPFDLTLALDVDAFLLDRVDSIWSYLDQDDLAIALDYYPTIGQAPFMSPKEAFETFRIMNAQDPQYGAGTILFRKSDRMVKFFDLWSQEWRRNRDMMHQYAFNRAIVLDKIPFAVLPQEYNYSFRTAPTVEQAHAAHVVIWQGWGNDHEDLFNAIPEVRDRVLALKPLRVRQPRSTT